MARRRISTGVEGLDRVIKGGFEEGKTYLLAGEAGTGKTIFCLQYLLAGISSGEPGVYVTVDEKPRHLIEDAESLGWDLQHHIDSKMMTILDITPHFSDLRLGRDQKIDYQTVVGDLIKHTRSTNARRLVIDPLGPLVADAEGEMVVRSYIRGLIFSVDDSIGVTTVCTSEIPTGTNKLSRFGVEEFLVSGVIVLGLERREFRFNRVLYVRKMRGTPVDLSIMTFSLERARGIVAQSIAV